MMEYSKFQEKMIDHATFPQKNHPPIDSDHLAHPEGKQEQHRKKPLKFGPHDFGNIKGNRQGNKKSQKCHQYRIDGRSDKR